jgi:hypothetical protein
MFSDCHKIIFSVVGRRSNDQLASLAIGVW